MTPARKAILAEAEHEAVILRRCGYPDAQVLPEYCIGGEIGADKIMTKTVSVYVGDYDESSIRPIYRSILGMKAKKQ